MDKSSDRKSIWQRMKQHPVLWLFLVTILVVAVLNPVKIGLLLWGVSKLACFAFLGNWIDGRFFADSQPDNLTGIEQGTAWKRKALLIAASILSGSLV